MVTADLRNDPRESSATLPLLQDGRSQKVRKLLPPPREALSNWLIISASLLSVILLKCITIVEPGVVFVQGWEEELRTDYQKSTFEIVSVHPLAAMTILRKWKLLQSQWVLNNPWCRVRRDQVELPNGSIIDDFFVNVRPDIALVLPVTPHQEIVFVRQYRHGVGEILLELPAGTFNLLEESGAAAAARELAEETGYVAEDLVKLATFYDNPVKDTNSVHLFLAKNVRRSKKAKLDITEEIEVVLVPLGEIRERIASGEVCVAGTVAAIFLGLEVLKNG